MSLHLSSDGMLGRIVSQNGGTGSRRSSMSSSLRSLSVKRRLSIPFQRRTKSVESDHEGSDADSNAEYWDPPMNNGSGSEADTHMIRIFLKDETYRTVRFTEDWKCGHILNHMWRRMEQLPGLRAEFLLYMVYKKDGARFVKDDEPAIVLVGDEMVQVEKVYLRHREDRAGVKRVSQDNGGKAEVVLKQGGLYGTVRGTAAAPNPYAEAMGGHHTIRHAELKSQGSLALAFSQAWERGTEIEATRTEQGLPPSPHEAEENFVTFLTMPRDDGANCKLFAPGARTAYFSLGKTSEDGSDKMIGSTG